MDGLSRAQEQEALPEKAGLEMKEGVLHARPVGRALPSAPRGVALRRWLVVGGAAGMTVAGAYQMYRVLGLNGLTLLVAAMVLLFALLFFWIALAFTSAIGGFWSMLRRGGLVAGDGPPLTRTALLMPSYNEDPARTAAALHAMGAGLAAAGQGERFDIFVLSDTTNPDIWVREEAAFLELRRRLAGRIRVFYRRRPLNTARKSGNIADWVRLFGAAYPQFLILDADSVMSADTLVWLAAAMERNPDVGLIQTLPVIVGGRTLFARLQQFAGRIYGPLIAHGLAWWSGAESNYWGHNAMIRTRAFAECAGLPVLRGRKPFGGHILSHDFVEAALLRRGGWAVHMLPGLPGSYEESPPSLMDVAVRDRRWCQGNLQHAGVLRAGGLHWVSRMHLLNGIFSYLTAPLWLLFLLTGLLIAVQAQLIPFDYFPAGRALFPRWPRVDPVRARFLFEAAMLVLLTPKLLGCVAVLIRGAERRACGGGLRVVSGVVVETLLAALIAPISMLTQTMDVVAILRGRDAGWNPQRRDDGGVALRDMVRRYLPHSLLGVALGATAGLISFHMALWMLPVIAGLVLAVPAAALSGSRGAGVALRRIGLLWTPEERRPPEVLVQARTGFPCAGLGVRDLFDDPALLTAHRRMLPAARRRGVDPISVPLAIAREKLEDAETLEEALGMLTPAEVAAALGNAEVLGRLCGLGRGGG